MPGPDRIQADVQVQRDLLTRLQQFTQEGEKAWAKLALLAEAQAKFYRTPQVIKEGNLFNDSVANYQTSGADNLTAAYLAELTFLPQVLIVPLADAKELWITGNANSANSLLMLYSLSAADNFNPIPLGNFSSLPCFAGPAPSGGTPNGTFDSKLAVEGYKFLHFAFVTTGGSPGDIVDVYLGDGGIGQVLNYIFLNYELRK